MKKLILTADDFGSSVAVNEAVEEAHVKGVLNTTSLMVGANAAADAVNRALRLPSLRVGLHVVLVAGRPVLPPATIPALVNTDGELSSHLFRAGVNFYFRASVRQQLEREIRAQFQAFQNTGLVLDHVNCHKHMHLHPTVGRILLKVAQEYGVKAMRYPYEPFYPSWSASRNNLGQKLVAWLFFLPWLDILKKQLLRAQVRSNHFVFGMNDSGNMNLNLVLRFIEQLPEGVTEMYFHPTPHRLPNSYQDVATNKGENELAALTSSTLAQALRDAGIHWVTFDELD